MERFEHSGAAIRRCLTVTAPHYTATALWAYGTAGWQCEAAAPLLHWMHATGPNQTRRRLSADGDVSWRWSAAPESDTAQQWRADHPAAQLAGRTIDSLHAQCPELEHGRGRSYAGIGARATPPDVQAAMQLVAAHLADAGWVLRSGGAPGADSAFGIGAGYAGSGSDPTRYEIYLPWPGFNRQSSPFDRPTPQAADLAAAHHPAWDRLSRGVKALQARNSHQVLGADLADPVEFVLAWTADGADNNETPPSSRTGGTGQAIRVAAASGVPVINLRNLERAAVPRREAKTMGMTR